MFNKADIKTFSLEDLSNRTIEIKDFNHNETTLIVAIDIKTGELFVLKEIIHPKNIQN